MADYKFKILNFAGTILGELPTARGKSWSRFLSAPGECLFHVSQDDPRVSQITEGITHLRISRDGTDIWEGLIDGSTEGAYNVTFRASTYELMLEGILTGAGRSYTERKIGTYIVKGCWDDIQGLTDSFFSGFADGTFEDPEDGGSPRAISIRFDYETMLAVFQKMTEIGRANNEGNCDFTFTIPRTFNFYKDLGTDQAGVTYIFPGQILDYALVTDASQISNRIIALGVSFSGSVDRVILNDATSRSTYKWRAEPLVLRGSSNIGANPLQAQAEDWLEMKKNPLKALAVTLKGGIAPLDGYSLGDSIKLKIENGKTSINEFYRVIGLAVDIGDSNEEIVTLYMRVPRT